MTLATVLEEIWGGRRRTAADDIRRVFGDYHNLLHWLTTFLTGDQKLANACLIDACTIAETQTPDFHEWLVRWAARGTVKCALQRQHDQVTCLAREYERTAPAHLNHPSLSPEQFAFLVRNSAELHAHLNLLCRFILILRGIAIDSSDEVAAELGISRSAVDHAYCVAFDRLEAASHCGQPSCSL